MKITFYILTLLLLTSCGNNQRGENISVKSDTTKTDTTEVGKKKKPKIQFTDIQLESYLDSIGGLSTSLLADKVSFIADSTFKGQLQMDKLISESDFTKLKQAIKEKDVNDRVIDFKTAKSIFGVFQIDSSYLETGKIPLTVCLVLK